MEALIRWGRLFTKTHSKGEPICKGRLLEVGRYIESLTIKECIFLDPGPLWIPAYKPNGLPC